MLNIIVIMLNNIVITRITFVLDKTNLMLLFDCYIKKITLAQYFDDCEF